MEVLVAEMLLDYFMGSFATKLTKSEMQTVVVSMIGKHHH